MKKQKQLRLLSLTLLLTLGFAGSIAYWAYKTFRTNPQVVQILDAPKGFAAFAADHSVPFGTWQYGGSTAFAAIRDVVDRQIQQDIPNFRLAYTQDPIQSPSSGVGIQMLTEGRLSFAQASRPLTQEEVERATARGIRLKQIPVAYDAIVVVVHPISSLKGVTIPQLVGIYTGKVKNWREVGGDDLPIKPYLGEAGGGSETTLKSFFAAGEDFAPAIERLRTPSQALQRVGGNDRGGIYMASSRTVLSQCSVKPLAIGRDASALVAPYLGDLVPADRCPQQRNQLNPAVIAAGDYPLTRRLFVVAREDDSDDAKAGATYAEMLLTPEGQRLIQTAGFVPLRSF